MSGRGTSQLHFLNFMDFFAKQHGLVILLPVRSIIFLTENAIEQLTTEQDSLHLKYVR